MEHNEFVEKTRSNAIVWGVERFYRAVFLVWGTSGLFWILAASLLILAPALAFVLYCLLHSRFFAVAWTLPVVLAFLAGIPNLNLIAGSIWVLCALIGVVVAVFFGPLHLVGALLPFLTWFLSGALKGTTMVSMEDRLRESQESYRRLKESGILIIHGA
jgi:hypothetical protein